MTPRRVTVIIVTYRSRDTIEATLEALAPAHEAGWLDCKVIDNNSGDGSHEIVAGRFPWVAAVQSGGNLGFGRANNLGFEGVDTPYTFFLNPDAHILPDSLERLLDFMDNHAHVGIAGPGMRHNGYPGQLISRFPTPRSIIREALGRRPQAYFVGAETPPFRVDWATGAVLLIRTDLLRRLGGFDPRFFLYFEETDLCRRARLLGAETWICGGAVAEHRAGHSANQEVGTVYRGCLAEHFFRSRYYYMRKHHGYFRATAVEVAEFAILAGRALRHRWRGTEDVHDLRVRLRSPFLRQPSRELEPGNE
jgi:N-acetylglucosaminyl-diphospho-decaprenol L-rhamnosyltransferase